ncbi:polysaccharide lyase family 8 super-sandwich domain-containing protein [Vibrio cholerae]|uniref:polysaccharide lyase family 8 super-sandwich domain-containing protein n=1 Tax=Vibrio cholerae TaxID=666 RepID=UPI0011DA4F64|nr:polysaccharide lyase family 8 super-sandwich domain-containing protein [Vibrio cholerae]TXY76476.1 polysaccharide lyase 8 family protein [Vibrio cholerae]GHX10206.1 hypothetical protein VCSRO106_2023 [Vibrio cholerae]
MMINKLKTKWWLLAPYMICQSALADDIQTLTQRIAPDFAQVAVEAAQGLGQPLSTLAAQYLANQQTDGHWSDIDYAAIPTQEAPIREHLTRVRALAAQYYLSNDPTFAAGAIAGLYHWYSADRTNSNWWWNEIGKQIYLGPTAFLLGNQLPSDLSTLIRSDMPTEPYKTGANRTDISKGVIYGGLLGSDSSQVKRGLGGIEETIVFTEAEGVQADFSFQQHGAQLYNGGYGDVFFEAASYWAYQVRDLQWHFAPDKNRLVADYFLDGVRWMSRHGTLDYNARGRGLSRVDKANLGPILRQADYVAALAPERAAEAQQFKQHVNGAPESIAGFRSFYRSDYASKVGNGHFIGIKMNSKRIKPTEAGNGENLLGNWIGFGSTFIMQRGDEYHGIFPVWNWALVPGTTAPQFAIKPADWGRIEMQTQFVGSVSDGRNGVAVMDMDAYQTKAKKAWFSFDDELVALGAGIQSTRAEYVNTTVNQTRLNGPVTVDGQVYSEGSRQLVNASWVHHDGIGYVFPANWYGHMDNQTQNGNWRNINTGQPDAPVSADVFMLRIGHSWQPTNASYQYIVVPNRDAQAVANYAASVPVSVLSNTPQIQAVTHVSKQVSGIVFHQAGMLQLPSGKTVTVNKPSVLVIDESQATPQVTLATPGIGDQVQLKVEEGSTVWAATVVTAKEPRLLGKGVVVEFNAVPVIPPMTMSANVDAFVRDGQYANQSFGTNSYLVVKSDITGYNRKTVLKFDLSQQALSSHSQAVLRLHVKNVNTAASRAITVSRLKSSAWQENSLTWSTLPPIEQQGTTVTISPSQVNEWIEIDVSNLIVQGELSLLLENKGAAHQKSDVNFSSKESGLAPQLVIQP